MTFNYFNSDHHFSFRLFMLRMKAQRAMIYQFNRDFILKIRRARRKKMHEIINAEVDASLSKEYQAIARNYTQSYF